MTTKELSVSRSGNSEESCGSRKLSRRHFCFYKINNFNLSRLGTSGEAARLHSAFEGREREAGHLSHTTNKADITPQLFKKVTFQVHMDAIHMYLYITLQYLFFYMQSYFVPPIGYHVSRSPDRTMDTQRAQCSEIIIVVIFFSFLCPLKKSTKI